MLAVTVDFVVPPEHLDAFSDAVREQARRSLEREPDCHRFDVCVDPTDATHVLLYEIYTDAAAFERHLASEHFRAFDVKVRDWVAAKDVRTWALAPA